MFLFYFGCRLCKKLDPCDKIRIYMIWVPQGFLSPISTKCLKLSFLLRDIRFGLAVWRSKSFCCRLPKPMQIASQTTICRNFLDFLHSDMFLVLFIVVVGFSIQCVINVMMQCSTDPVQKYWVHAEVDVFVPTSQ